MSFAAPKELIFLWRFHSFCLEGHVPMAEDSSRKAGCASLSSQQPRGGWPCVPGQVWEPEPSGRGEGGDRDGHRRFLATGFIRGHPEGVWGDEGERLRRPSSSTRFVSDHTLSLEAATVRGYTASPGPGSAAHTGSVDVGVLAAVLSQASAGGWKTPVTQDSPTGSGGSSGPQTSQANDRRG